MTESEHADKSTGNDETRSECDAGDPVSTKREIESESESGKAVLRWRSHPFRENPGKSALLLVTLGFVWWAVYIWSGGEPILTILSIILLMGTLSPYFFVTSYELDDSFIIHRRGQMEQKKKWTEFRRYYLTSTCVQLSPFFHATRLESFRSLTLLTPPDKRDEILTFVRDHMPQEESDDDDDRGTDS